MCGGVQQPPSTADPLLSPSRPSPGTVTPGRDGARKIRSKLQHTLVLELVSWGGGVSGGSADPGAGAEPVPCPQDGTLLYSSLLARGQQGATATFTVGFQESSYKVGAWGVGRWVWSHWGRLGGCDLGPGVMRLCTATPCGLCATVPCS